MVRGNPGINLNRGIISIILVGISIILSVLIFSYLALPGTTTSTDTSSTNATIINLIKTLSPVQDGITSLTITRYNKTWLDFDGVNDWINASDDDVLKIERNNFSVIMFIKRDTRTVSASEFLFGKDGDGGTDDFSAYIFTDGQVKFRIGGTGYSTTSLVNNSQILMLGFSADRNSTTGGKIIINGNVDVNNINVSLSAGINISSIESLIIGRRDSGNYFNGSMYDFMIFDKPLTEYQMKAIYNESKYGNDLRKSIPVPYYHYVDNIHTNSLYVQVENFTEQMAYLNNSGFETITFNDYNEWTEGNFDMPEKPIILSFDDGAISVYTNASEIMDNYGYIGSLGVITSKIGTSNYMTWSQVQDLKSRGWEIVSHSVYHNVSGSNVAFVNLSSEQLIYEFNQSRWDIYNNISFLPNIFTFPGNSYNSTVSGVCSQFYDVCTGSGVYGVTTPRYIHFRSNKTYEDIYRFGIYNSTTLHNFEKAVDIYQGEIFRLKLNENNGTTAYDSSGNGNNGTISGATWNNDGILNTLINNVDYSLNTLTGYVTLTEDSRYSWLNFNWNYNTVNLSEAGEASIELEQSMSESTIWLTVLIVVLFAGVIFSYLKSVNLPGKEIPHY